MTNEEPKFVVVQKSYMDDESIRYKVVTSPESIGVVESSLLMHNLAYELWRCTRYPNPLPGLEHEPHELVRHYVVGQVRPEYSGDGPETADMHVIVKLPEPITT